MEKQRQKILVIDDSEMNRAILADMLEDDYDILEAADGVEGVKMLERHAGELSLVLLDIVMPNMDGFEVLSVMNQNRWIEDVPVIMVSAESGSSQVERAYEMGVTDFIMRPFDALIVRRRVVNTILLYAKQKRLVAMVNDQIAEKEKRSGLMIDILSHIVEFRNGESGMHILHVRKLTDLLLRHLVLHTDRYPLSGTEITLYTTASALHDIGKIAIPEHILNKPGRLTAEEFSVMKTHTSIGAQMLEQLSGHKGDPLVQAAYTICRWHHERWDGRGYPDGLSGDAIPIAAQVVALADVYDALTSERVYKKALPHEKAVEMILNGECGAFNPFLLDCLREIAPSLRAVMEDPDTHMVNEAYETAQDLLRSEEHALSERAASERTLRLLDHERMKFHFFAALTEEIQFEYTVTPPRITLSPWGAQRLELTEIIDDPRGSAGLQEVLGPGAWEEVASLLRATTPEDPERSWECRLRIGGELRWHKVFARAIWSSDAAPKFEGALGKAIDIHDTRVRMEEIERKASSDGLTHLYNRASAQEIIIQRLLANPEGCYALAIFDLDNLKTINDNHGHAVGDAVLKFLAGRLATSVRGRDISARAGGDEFLLFLEYRPTDDIAHIVQRIFEHLCGTCAGCTVTVSMGVACSQLVGSDYETLFRAADKALYAAKRAGKARYRFYDETMKDMFTTMTDIDSDSDGKGGTPQ